MRTISFKASSFMSIIVIVILLTSLFTFLFVSATEVTITETSLLLTDGSKPMLGNLDMNQYQIVEWVVHKSDSAPSSPVEGQLFYDTGNYTLYIYNGTAWSNIIGGGGVSDHGALSGLTDDDHSQYVLEDGTRVMSGNLNMTQNEIIDGVFHSGSTPPASPVEGQWFYDTDVHTLYVYNSTAWESVIPYD